jgi:hypothetical protein
MAPPARVLVLLLACALNLAAASDAAQQPFINNVAAAATKPQAANDGARPHFCL